MGRGAEGMENERKGEKRRCLYVTDRQTYTVHSVVEPATKRAPYIMRRTSGYATMVHGRGCNPHRSTRTFAKPEMTSLMTSWEMTSLMTS